MATGEAIVRCRPARCTRSVYTSGRWNTRRGRARAPAGSPATAPAFKCDVKASQLLAMLCIGDPRTFALFVLQFGYK